MGPAEQLGSAPCFIWSLDALPSWSQVNMGWQGAPLSSLGLSSIKPCDASVLEVMQSAKPDRDLLPTTVWKHLQALLSSSCIPLQPQGHLTPLDGEFSSSALWMKDCAGSRMLLKYGLPQGKHLPAHSSPT